MYTVQLSFDFKWFQLRKDVFAIGLFPITQLTDAPCKIGGFGSQGVIAAKEEVALEVDARHLRHTAVGQEEYIRAEFHRLSRAMVKLMRIILSLGECANNNIKLG